MKNTILKYGISALIWFSYTFPAYAQESHGDPNDPYAGDDVPIDMWAIWLLAFGTIAGIYFAMKQRKEVV